MLRLKLDPEHPAADQVRQIADIIRRGGVVALPTDTVYGLAVDPFNAQAVARVFAIKERPQEQPLLLLIDAWEQAERLTTVIPAAARRVMTAFWPGPLTLILPGRADLPAPVLNSRGGVALRLPDQAFCRELVRAVGPITAPSANLHGQPSARRVAELGILGERVDAVVDGGTSTRLESALLDAMTESPELVRSGSIPGADIMAAANSRELR
jgi:L-threonylcarbamoyladenylate synthase